MTLKPVLTGSRGGPLVSTLYTSTQRVRLSVSNRIKTRRNISSYEQLKFLPDFVIGTFTKPRIRISIAAVQVKPIQGCCFLLEQNSGSYFFSFKDLVIWVSGVRVRSLSLDFCRMDELVGPRLYSCYKCRNHVSLHDDIISKAFQARGVNLKPNIQAFVYVYISQFWCQKKPMAKAGRGLAVTI
ncbi:Protein yippee-like 2 [Datura stramonium]|uniref:Protein yippee-like 2 n=1 Tax=Datura stramonium TaxID=4076 RepID=A0ABS8RPV2_DATST|nr:Protein yippee-like 2 [Datura stramonium]